MKKMKIYLNTFYRPAFLVLCLGLTVFSLTLITLSVNLHQEMLAGESDIIYRYPQMIEKILFPLYILLPTIFTVDMNERKKKAD